MARSAHWALAPPGIWTNAWLVSLEVGDEVLANWVCAAQASVPDATGIYSIAFFKIWACPSKGWCFRCWPVVGSHSCTTMGRAGGWERFSYQLQQVKLSPVFVQSPLKVQMHALPFLFSRRTKMKARIFANSFRCRTISFDPLACLLFFNSLFSHQLLGLQTVLV